MITAETRHFPLSMPLLPLLCTLVVTTYARSWDLAVLIDNGGIDFFARNGTLTNHIDIETSKELKGVTYDDTTQTMYISNADEHNNITIFSYILTEKNFKITPLVEKENGTRVVGIVFDKSSRSLFWTDSIKNNIVKMPLDGQPSTPVILHTLTGTSPRDIALDVCNRRIYWVSSILENSSIECSELDGSNRRIIVNGLHRPQALAIDHTERKLYWSDDIEGLDYKIERSNLDGSEREVLVDSSHQKPLYLAVDDESIYWTDWINKAIWFIPKKSTNRMNKPIQFKSYEFARATGIVMHGNVDENDCTAIVERKTLSEQQDEPVPQPIAEMSSNPTITIATKDPIISTEKSDLTTEYSKYCLNDGQLNQMDGTCRCKPGFAGPACESSLCYNYCLHGICGINRDGLPECKCTGTFSGARCEKDMCDGYCLHDGECSVQNGKPYCSCKYSKGIRCEEMNSVAHTAAAIASNRIESHSVTSCRCSDVNRTAESFSNSLHSRTILPIFVALTVLFVLMTAGLSYYVNKLRRRPRIKKRYVISKGVTQQLTSRPQIPDNQCEITIENCCNMNICETPCFEPKLRTEVPRSKKTRKEEKNSLLDNMDNSC